MSSGNQFINSSTGALSQPFLAWKPRQCLSFMFFLLSISVGAIAQTPTPAMPPASPEVEARLKLLETELRCLVCQNQTLADSPAGLAGDLRREIRLLADAGKSNEEIKQHLKARYGDFVLYKPQVESKTWVLWFGPFALLAAGVVVLAVMARRRRASANATSSIDNSSAGPSGLSAADQARAASLLGDGAEHR
jgi:cytochrome c-type biogenesis protein CcmH